MDVYNIGYYGINALPVLEILQDEIDKHWHALCENFVFAFAVIIFQ